MKNKIIILSSVFGIVLLSMVSCKPKNTSNAVSADAAEKAYVAPGKYDQYYNFVSGGFSNTNRGNTTQQLGQSDFIDPITINAAGGVQASIQTLK